MKRNSLYLCLALLFAMWPGIVRAQYGYGGGWGGWGGASTFQGSMARGMGMFSEGAGISNRNTAMAGSIERDHQHAAWNSYIFQGQPAANKRRP